MVLKNSRFILLISIFALTFSCTKQDLKFEKESKLKVEQILNSAENNIKVFGPSISGVDLTNENFETLSANILKSKVTSTYEATKAYLLSEECLRKKRLNIDRTIRLSNNMDWQEQIRDSVYHSFLKQAVLQFDSVFRKKDPTLQDLLIEIEKQKALKVELEKFCKKN